MNQQTLNIDDLEIDVLETRDEMVSVQPVPSTCYVSCPTTIHVP